MADNVLDIVLRFLVDEKSRKAAADAITGVGQTGAGTATVGPSQNFQQVAQSVITSAKQLNIPIEQAAKNLAGMATAGFQTEQQILADVAAFQQMEQASNNVAKSVVNIDKNMKQVNSTVRMGMVGMTGFVLSMTGMSLQRLGQGILKPIEDYTKFAGMASGASAAWLETQQELSRATLRIGASLATAVLPTMEKIASAAGKLATWMEANPALAKAAAGFAGGALVVGTLLMVGGQTMSTAAALVQLYQMIRASTIAAGAASAATAAGTATAGAAAGVGAGALAGSGVLATLAALALPLAALVAGVAALVALLKSEFGKGGVTAGKQILATAAAGAGVWVDTVSGRNVLQGEYETSRRWFEAAGRALGLLGDSAEEAAGQIRDAAGNMIPQAEVDAFIAYQQQETTAARQYEEQRAAIVRDYGRQRVQAESEYESRRAQLVQQHKTALADESANYARQTAQAARAYYQQEAQAEQDYYRNRARLAQSYSLEVQRAEEDHQRRMFQMAQDHALRIEELADQRDAYGILSEMRGYEQTRSEAEQEYAVQARRRSEDFALRMSEMEGQFAEERSRRRAEYVQRRAEAEQEYALRAEQRARQLAEQLKQLDEQHAAEMQQLDAEQREKLNQLSRQYQEERAARMTALSQQLRDLNGYFATETGLRGQYYQAWTAQFQQFVKANLSSLSRTGYPGVPGRASGGYVWDELYRVGENGYEFVLNHQTTALLEKLAGGRLTQNTIGGLIVNAASGGGKSLTYNDHRRIDGRVTARDRLALRSDNIQFLTEVLSGI